MINIHKQNTQKDVDTYAILSPRDTQMLEIMRGSDDVDYLDGKKISGSNSITVVKLQRSYWDKDASDEFLNGVGVIYEKIK